MTQMDLFDHQPSEDNMELATIGAPTGGAVIIAFPQGRNIGRVRHVATKFLERDGKPRDAYWRRIVDNMVAQLERAGLDVAQIEDQVAGFTRAVQLEIDLRCSYRGGSGRGDGVA